MKRAACIVLTLSLALLAAQCSDGPTSIDLEPRELTQAEKDLVGGSNAFGFNLFKKVAEQEEGRNLFVSPLSVSMALGMTLNGAQGETLDSMKKVLEFSGMTVQDINESYKTLIDYFGKLDRDVAFRIGNSIWSHLEFPIESEFVDVNRAYFDAEVRRLNFADPASVGIINDWVYDKTNGKITEIIRSIDPGVMMYLINAIYFKGFWTFQFDPKKTRDAPFYLADGGTVQCKMMRQKMDVQYMESEDFSAIELPYGDGDFGMVILLPHEGVDLDVLIASFSDDNWNSWMTEFHEVEKQIGMPKLELEYEISLRDVLTALGMGVAFDAFRADFNGISKGSGLFIGEVIHKTYVKVDEEGTEAAAVTVVVMPTAPPPNDFIVDRPFAFAIRERHSGTLLFMGKIVEPVM